MNNWSVVRQSSEKYTRINMLSCYAKEFVKEIQDAKWRGRMARQFDTGSAMAKLMAVQTSLESLASVK